MKACDLVYDLRHAPNGDVGAANPCRLAMQRHAGRLLSWSLPTRLYISLGAADARMGTNRRLSISYFDNPTLSTPPSHTFDTMRFSTFATLFLSSVAVLAVSFISPVNVSGILIVNLLSHNIGGHQRLGGLWWKSGVWSELDHCQSRR